jgi:hypothetical protein
MKIEQWRIGKGSCGQMRQKLIGFSQMGGCIPGKKEVRACLTGLPLFFFFFLNPQFISRHPIAVRYPIYRTYIHTLDSYHYFSPTNIPCTLLLHTPEPKEKETKEKLCAEYHTHAD